MKAYVVVMTGHNVANLSPLLNAWCQDDRVLLVPTAVCTDDQVVCFKAALEKHGVHGVDTLSPLGPHPIEVAGWCKANRGRLLGGAQASAALGGAGSLVLIGNGGTKPMQDMLRVGLGDVQGVPVTTLYAEAKPVRLLRLQDDAAAACKAWEPGSHRQVQLHDVLAVAGHDFRYGSLLWSSVLVTQPPAALPQANQPDMACFAAPWAPGQAGALPKPPPDLLSALHRQVASAVLALLAPGEPLAKVAAELWVDVEAGVEAERVPRACWDVLLLLRNGILVHMDCSAWWPAAPADATHEAMRALIDRTVWCVPLPPAIGDGNTLAHACHEALRRHGRLGRRALKWLWPDQTVSFDNKRLCDGAFESELKSLLADYTDFLEPG